MRIRVAFSLAIAWACAAAPIAHAVEGLRAEHRSGQTLLTWREVEDRVGRDDPTFEQLHDAVAAARAARILTYRVYRSDRPISGETLGKADLVREVPEIVSGWDLRAVRNTEHPNQGAPTMTSELRPGYNLVRACPVARYRLPDGTALPRAMGIAVFTATRAVRSYYAVTVAIDGREKVADLASLREPVEETPAPFPAYAFQRRCESKERDGAAIDVLHAWIEPPLHNVPSVSELYIVRWPDVRAAGPRSVPLFINLGTYGTTATEQAEPGWHGARRHVPGALTIGLAEGGLWQGFHAGCTRDERVPRPIGTSRGYDDGVVHNYPQRRALAAAAWAVAQPDLSIDPERVSLWGQLGAWALRHGDVFAVVMSNGYGNPAIGKEAQKHGPLWGPYPKGSKNWLGIDQWDYMNLPRWIRTHPEVELPFWLCWPAYGAYPSHEIGDFGFLPWPEMFHAMASTKRAFAATWSSNGPGVVGPLRALVPRIRLHQSLPAFTRCSLDTSPGDGDHADAEKYGGINVYLLWEPETIVDEADRWENDVSLREDAPAAACTVDLTPRRVQRFRARAGERFGWSSADPNGRVLQKGEAEADRIGLVTIEGLDVAKERRRVAIRRP